MTKTDIQSIINKRPLIIAGPCSAESEQQVMQTVQKLSDIERVSMIRAGIWKPRTRPGSFEGVGEKGIDWLISAREETNLPVIIEVAMPEHVEHALEKGVDAVWIGARTTVNPFSVQAIADTLEENKANIPVFIKNPINPEVKLWNGAVERIQRAGIQNIGLIHRGFSTPTKSRYRYEPLWNLAGEMRDEHPGKAFICDPSHIAGNRDLLLEVSQEAASRGFDGLMIESHIDPNAAKSDAEQQITPEKLSELLDHTPFS